MTVTSPEDSGAAGGLSGSKFSGCVTDVVFGRRSIQGFRMTPWYNAHDARGQEGIMQVILKVSMAVLPHHHRTISLVAEVNVEPSL